MPIVTWPQTRVVSRQTFALLSSVGLPELAGDDADDYIRIAVKLALYLPRLKNLRMGLRTRLQSLSLMDTEKFARSLEDCLINLAA